MELIIILSTLLAATIACLSIKRKRWMGLISVGAAIATFAGAIAIAIQVASAGALQITPYFRVDSMGAIMTLIIGLVSVASAVYSAAYFHREVYKGIISPIRAKQYYVLTNLFLAAMIVTVTSSSPILTWIAIEATTLSTAFLICFYNNATGMEAAWKYLIINSVGLLLAFFGTLLFFTAINAESGLVTWQTLADSVTRMDPTVAKIAFVFVLIGYGTKVGFAPLHTWLPDAHSKAPAPVSALLSGVLLSVGLVVVLRFRTITDSIVGPEFSQHLFIAFGLLSLLVAAMLILLQHNYKRLLAYSSIENMGIIALGFGFGGIGVYAAWLHIIYHAIIKSALFLAVGTVSLRYASARIDKVTGMLSVLPVTSLIMFAGIFGAAGSPPFGIFLTKLLILFAGVESNLIVAIIAMLLIAIVFIGFVKHSMVMAFGTKPEGIKLGERVWLVLPPLALLLVALGLSFYIPEFLQTLIGAAAQN